MNERAFDRAHGGETATNLPTTTTRIVGREETIELIERDVGEARLVSIVGAGGIGKTTVALAVAENAIESFPDGVWLVDFAPLKLGALVPHAVAAATGLVVHSANVMTALSRFLRDQRTLLVLDSCEHLVDEIASCVSQILEAAPGVHILITSRAPLRLPHEQVRRLPGLGLPPSSDGLTAKEALRFPAIELFVERATERYESFALHDADAPAVADICKKLDGIALALELAAMRIDVFGVDGLQKQLDDRFQLLGERRAGTKRHRTLAATLDWSYGLLRAHEATVLCAVSVFAGAFRLHDAAAISKLPSGEAAAVLGELAAQSLLSVDAEADRDSRDPLYRPLETTRAYGLEKLVASGDDQSVRLRHAEHVRDVIEAAALELATRPAREWSAAYGRYLAELRAALAWTAADASQRRLLVRLTAAGTALWNHFSLTEESRMHLERAISALPGTGFAGTAVEMNLQLAFAGAVLYTRGMMPEARDAMHRALEIAVQRNDTDYHLRCLRMIGTYELFNGNNDVAMQTLEAFVAMATTSDPSAVADGETHLGCGELFIGRVTSARERLERLYANGLQDLNDSTSLRFLYNNSINVMIVLSHTQWLTGSPGAAERTAEMVVEYALEADHEISLSNALAWVCLVFLWTGREKECARYTAMLEDLAERHGIVTWGPTATFCRGALASMQSGSLAAGIEDLERAVARCHELGHFARFPYYVGMLGEALVRQGRLEKAEATIHESLALATRQNESWSLPELLRIQASLLAAQGKPEEQEVTLVKSMVVAESLGASSWRLRAATDLARLWQTQSRALEAKRMLEPVFATFTDGFDTRDLTAAAKLLAELE